MSRPVIAAAPAGPDHAVAARVDALDWPAIEQSLAERGFAVTGPLLAAAECRDLIGLFGEDTRFRSRVDMARHRFGVGEYKYFADPLPPLVGALRSLVYPRLVPVANRWAAVLGERTPYPADLDGLRALCARHGQTRPTPLLLHYEAGGYNCLHQDLYGQVAFPLQLTCLLSDPDRAFEGGEFILVEQRPRQQSRAEVVPLALGEAVIF
ncbi:MAG TPA: 2OG-Fe(II) oxygenase, partial [Candidatus Limnocylindrales bacterium]|nr:2OG-Fe(II) oxygenase [Candidatus Limnocylindrales bacterium]